MGVVCPGLTDCAFDREATVTVAVFATCSGNFCFCCCNTITGYTEIERTGNFDRCGCHHPDAIPDQEAPA